jgi:hypothetical protein
MNKKFFIGLVLVLFLAGVAFAQLFYSFFTIYWVTGTVNDENGVKANGYQVVFYKSLDEYQKGNYAIDTVGPTGTAGTSNRYAINTAFLAPFTVGSTYSVAVVQDDDGYGAGPVNVTISGKGYDEAPEMTMCKGCGVPPPDAPIIEQVKFDERVYFQELVDDGEKFYTSPAPKVTAIIKGVGTAGVNKDKVYLVVNEGEPGAPQPYTMSVPVTTVVSGTSVIGSLIAEFGIPESEPLPEDPDADKDSTVTIKAENIAGIQSVKECTVTVAGGPMRIIGEVLAFPSPFSPSKDKELEIQYTLSQAGNITIYIVNIAGETVKRISCSPGEEGGNAGRNKVKWNGRYETGEIAGNGVYVGTVIDRDRNKLLARFKFTIFD